MRLPARARRLARRRRRLSSVAAGGRPRDFHAIGLGYSYRIVPTPRGLRRFKDTHLFKNTMSAVLFVLSVIAYPLLGRAGPLQPRRERVAALAIFFFLFEHTFEVIYDLRDLEGDRAVGVPTYPVATAFDVGGADRLRGCAASIGCCGWLGRRGCS